jgi:hypothetical protein
VRNTATGEVIPSWCKGALGKWRAQERLTVRTQSRNYGVSVVARRAGDITSSSGAYASARLSSLRPGKILRGHAAAANRTREIRPSGMRGGLAETCAMEVGLRTSRKLAGTSTESYGGARRISTRRQRNEYMRISIWLITAAAATGAVGSGCAEQPITRYETVADARADRLFERGWLPDVLPDHAGPIVERHDRDTNARCAVAEFPATAMNAVISALVDSGFGRTEAHAPALPFRSCPFALSEVRSAEHRLQRTNPDVGDLEFAALAPRGRLLFWSGTSR